MAGQGTQLVMEVSGAKNGFNYTTPFNVSVWVVARAYPVLTAPPCAFNFNPAVGVGNVKQFKLVPLAGLEPARCCHHLILSQARLPIPPQGQVIDL